MEKMGYFSFKHLVTLVSNEKAIKITKIVVVNKWALEVGSSNLYNQLTI